MHDFYLDTEAGKSELPIPTYVNAWLGPAPGMESPGQYPLFTLGRNRLEVRKVATY